MSIFTKAGAGRSRSRRGPSGTVQTLASLQGRLSRAEDRRFDDFAGAVPDADRRRGPGWNGSWSSRNDTACGDENDDLPTGRKGPKSWPADQIDAAGRRHDAGKPAGRGAGDRHRASAVRRHFSPRRDRKSVTPFNQGSLGERVGRMDRQRCRQTGRRRALQRPHRSCDRPGVRSVSAGRPG